MANGFKGKSAESYFNVTDTTFVKPVSDKLMGKADGGSYVVSADEGKLTGISQLVYQTDEEIAHKFQHIISEIRILCGTDFVVPAAVPRIEIFLKGMEESLSHYIDLSTKFGQISNQFMGQIKEVDSGKSDGLFLPRDDSMREKAIALNDSQELLKRYDQSIEKTAKGLYHDNLRGGEKWGLK